MDPNAGDHGRRTPRGTLVDGADGNGADKSDAAGRSPAPADARRSAGGEPGRRPLEVQPSAVRYVLFDGRSGSHAGAGTVPDPVVDFGFPTSPVIAGSDRAGALFDTTAPTVTASGETIHYALRFGGRRTPYVLRHEGGGTYASRGAVASFEWTDQERFPVPGLAVGRPYRAVVRDVIQLYEPGGPFDWAVSRTDFFDRRAGVHAVSMLYVVWDLDGPANDADDDRGAAGRPVSDPAGPAAPSFPDDATPTVRGTDISGTVRSLIDAGVSDAAGG